MRTAILVLLLTTVGWGEVSFPWLVGHWRAEDGMEETWSASDGSSMLGTCREARSGHVEFMLLEEGTLLLYLPRSNKQMQLHLERQGEREAVFAREGETLTYKLLPDGRLNIRLVKGQQTFDYKFSRQK